MKKISAAICTALSCIMALSAVSCGNKGTDLVSSGAASSDVSVGDLPYGATITDLSSDYDPGVVIEIEFDRRFFDEQDGKYPEIYKITEYIKAIETQDVELLKKTYFPEYLDYYVETAGYDDAADYLASCHDQLTDSLGEDYSFIELAVSDCVFNNDPDAVLEFDGLDERLDSIGDEKISEKVTSRRKVTIGGDTMYSLGGSGTYFLSSTSTQSITLYVYQIDGEYWIL